MSKYKIDENGFITIPDNPISRSGVFQYLGSSISPSLIPDKIYNVYRPESELNNPKTIESFRLTPWIPEHKMLGDGFTPAESVGVQGVTGETVEFRNGVLYSTLKLFGEGLKSLVKTSLKELSCGMFCDWEIKSGITPSGEPYDVIQKNIRGNHLASVETGRAGSDVRVVMDKAVFALDSIEIHEEQNTMPLEELIKVVAEQTETLKSITTAMDEMDKNAKDMAKDMKAMKADSAKDEEAEDEEAKKKKAEDMEKKEKAMDEAIETINSLKKEIEEIKSTAMDAAGFMKVYAEKEELANKASSIVGAFDSSEMDSSGVAKYALEKMGIACDSGQELPMFKGILHAQKAESYTVDYGNAQDSADIKDETKTKLGF